MIDGFHRPEYQFLSNFYELRPGFWISLRNPDTGTRLVLPTAEHAYQACKFKDDQHREEIYHCRYAGQAKKQAEIMAWSVRPDWKQISLEVMERVVKQKFKDPQLLDLLLATDDELIQESNWWGDDFWGVVTKEHGRPCVPYGQNHLGKILMKVREELRHGLYTSTLSA